ncbi:hypothetical protein TgHK011_004923 [Trichoderma gracile]|nr:hypothetical protein TgHK011_004923 [Trichoderma gracile]
MLLLIQTSSLHCRPISDKREVQNAINRGKLSSVPHPSSNGACTDGLRFQVAAFTNPRTAVQFSFYNVPRRAREGYTHGALRFPADFSPTPHVREACQELHSQLRAIDCTRVFLDYGIVPT